AGWFCLGVATGALASAGGWTRHCAGEGWPCHSSGRYEASLVRIDASRESVRRREKIGTKGHNASSRLLVPYHWRESAGNLLWSAVVCQVSCDKVTPRRTHTAEPSVRNAESGVR